MGTKARCQQMSQYENKCKWTECPVTTPTPGTNSPTTTSPSSPTTTSSLSSTTSAGPTCARETQIDTCVMQGGVFECSRCTNGVSSEACCSCLGGEPSSTTSTATLPPS